MVTHHKMTYEEFEEWKKSGTPPRIIEEIREKGEVRLQVVAGKKAQTITITNK